MFVATFYRTARSCTQTRRNEQKEGELKQKSHIRRDYVIIGCERARVRGPARALECAGGQLHRLPRGPPHQQLAEMHSLDLPPTNHSTLRVAVTFPFGQRESGSRSR